MILPNPARLIAAIMFIALVASAIHFLATKPSSGAHRVIIPFTAGSTIVAKGN